VGASDSVLTFFYRHTVIIGQSAGGRKFPSFMFAGSLWPLTAKLLCPTVIDTLWPHPNPHSFLPNGQVMMSYYLVLCFKALKGLAFGTFPVTS
jgi:hypothetical protein